jgi:hypothetical protein
MAYVRVKMTRDYDRPHADGVVCHLEGEAYLVRADQAERMAAAGSIELLEAPPELRPTLEALLDEVRRRELAAALEAREAQDDAIALAGVPAEVARVQLDQAEIDEIAGRNVKPVRVELDAAEIDALAGVRG